MGTNEFLLVELIMGRPGPEIRWLKTGYRLRYGKDLTDAVKSDVSGKIERSAYLLRCRLPNLGIVKTRFPLREKTDSFFVASF